LLGHAFPDHARHETIETIDDISRKNSAATHIISDAETGRETMLKPTFRFFIIPLGAIVTLASMSAQNATPRMQRSGDGPTVHQQVIDCSTKSPSEVCVISVDSETR
jgi:hypothetical protein